MLNTFKVNKILLLCYVIGYVIKVHYLLKRGVGKLLFTLLECWMLGICMQFSHLLDSNIFPKYDLYCVLNIVSELSKVILVKDWQFLFLYKKYKFSKMLHKVLIFFVIFLNIMKYIKELLMNIVSTLWIYLHNLPKSAKDMKHRKKPLMWMYLCSAIDV